MKKYVILWLAAVALLTGAVCGQHVFQAQGASGMEQVTHNPSERGIVHTPPYHHDHQRRNVIILNSYPYYYPSLLYRADRDIFYQDVPVRAAPTYQAPIKESEPFALGRDWGQDLRREIVTWEQFVALVKNNVLKSPLADREEFRRGFASGYGANADVAYAKAIREAVPPTAEAEVRPKVIISPYGKVEARP